MKGWVTYALTLSSPAMPSGIAGLERVNKWCKNLIHPIIWNSGISAESPTVYTN
jgi:hypothetical protein